MAQRLLRAKQKIRLAGILTKCRSAKPLGPRLRGVLAVIYLVFTEGYVATSGGKPDAPTGQSRSDPACRLTWPHSLREDEIDHREHPAQPRPQCFALRHFVRDAGEADFLLGAEQALRHRVLAHQKGARDCAVVSPQTVRSVSATCTSVANADGSR